MNLEKGMYVRSSLGELGTITSIVNDNLGDFGLYGQFYNTEPSVLGEVVKASHNIIDLIEQGDYANGYIVTTASNNTGSIYIDLKDNNGLRTKLYNEDIKTILTHEQFEKNCYKVIEN